jgi:hypothetical protein
MTDVSAPERPRGGATSTKLVDYRIHDVESFNQTTGAGHEIAGLYFYQQLDCLVDLAYRVACDFFNRPHLYIDVDGLSETLARLDARYGTDETLPSGPQRDRVFLPIFGSGGVRTLPAAVASTPETGDFPVLRDDLLKAASAFAERAVDSGVEMLRARVKDAHRPMADYLNGLEGDSVRWSRFNAFPTVTETFGYTILRNAGIATVFGTPPASGNFPYVEESGGQKLVENVWKQLAGDESPILNRERISNLQRVALRGAEALATIIDFQENFDNGDLDRLITKLYTWDAALWSLKVSGTPNSAADISASYAGAAASAPRTSRRSAAPGGART